MEVLINPNVADGILIYIIILIMTIIMKTQTCKKSDGNGAINNILHLQLSLLAKFSLISFILTATIAAGLAWGIQQQMEKNAVLHGAESASHSVANILNLNLHMTDLTGTLDPIRYQQINTLIQKNIIPEQVARVKIWNRDGMVIYSDDKNLIGNRYSIDGELKEALSGKVAADISSLKKEENIGERGNFTRLLEVYVPLQPADSPEIAGAYEIYYNIAALEPQIEEIRRFVWGTIGIGFLILYASLFMIVRNASNELIRRNEENERLYEETKKQLAELKLAEEKVTQLATYPELNPGPIIEVDMVGKVHYLNPAALRILPDIQTAGIKHQFLSGLDAVPDDPSRDLMRLTEGETIPHQVVRKVRGRGISPSCGLFHPVPVHAQAGEHPGKNRKRSFERIHGVKKRLFVLLQIPVVGQGETLERG